jgi:hypothetical protein
LLNVFDYLSFIFTGSSHFLLTSFVFGNSVLSAKKKTP